MNDRDHQLLEESVVENMALLRRKLADLERLLAELRSESVPKQGTVKPRVTLQAANADQKPSLNHLVRKAIEAAPHRFDTASLRDHVRKNTHVGLNPNSLNAAVNFVLKGLVEDNKIKLIEPGIGGKPAIFEKT